jgi:hypothetical protein
MATGRMEAALFDACRARAERRPAKILIYVIEDDFDLPAKNRPEI